MNRTLRRLLAGAALAGSVALCAPPVSASPPQCQYYIVAGRVLRVCRPV